MHFRLRESLLHACLRLLKAMDPRDTSLSRFDPASVRTIYLVSSTALGDTVLSTAAFGAVRRRYPNAHIIALIHAAYAPLFALHSDVDEVWPYYGGYRRFFRTAIALRARHIDLALVLHGNEPQATPLAYLAGARFIVKLPNTSRFRFLLSNREPVLTWQDFRHGIDQRLAVAAAAGASVEGARMALPAPTAAVAAVAGWLKSQGVSNDSVLIGFQVGASSRSRAWPAAHFVELASRLACARPALRIIVLGSPAECKYAGEIAAAIGPAACVAAGVLPIETLPALVARLAVVVTGDTGTLHVAVAVRTPTVALFAVSDPNVSGPAYDMELHTIIRRPYALSTGTKSDDQAGMAAIGTAEVEAAVLERLALQEAEA